MARGPARNPELEQQWRRRLRDWQRSGLSGREFCRRHALSEPSFYSWRREIAQRDLESPSVDCDRVRPSAVVAEGEPFASRRARPAGQRRSAFVPVRVVATTALEVVVRSGQVVRVGPGFDATHLRAVVAALEAASC